ncbi:MAG: putative manganese transporter [Euryarchaeota archaeon]|nr:putative manganese transporter [Euryarchaeota archaeon]
MNELISVLNKSVIVTIFVFVMLLLIDYINVFTEGKMEKAVRGGHQYLTASLLGATPGCLGSFMNVSFYVHGLLSFGAIVGGMIATSGDEAFVMLALFPKKAVLLFVLLFLLGILAARISDRVASTLGIIPCAKCDLQEIHTAERKHHFQLFILKKFFHLPAIRYALLILFASIIGLNLIGIWGPQQWSWDAPERIILLSLTSIALFVSATASEHYLTKHIWGHILKKHIWKVFLWTFFALFIVSIGLQHWDLKEFVSSHMGMILLISAVVGIIPESGPHMVFVMMYAEGLIPFSVLLTSSIVQDGHGMLPLFSYTIRDSVLIKAFNLTFALVIGATLYSLGL